MHRKWVLWTIAILIFLASAVYQRLTGPTYPVRGSAEVAGETVRYRLARSHGGPTDFTVSLRVPTDTISATIAYKRYKTRDPWTEIQMVRQGEILSADLPHQPPAGKLQYRITLQAGAERIAIPSDEPIVIRFKGAVPLPILLAHIFFMSVAMILSNRTGLEAIRSGPNIRTQILATLVTLFIGGLILGPIVQWYAFGAFWAGWPFGHDLTDNKTLVAFIFWVVALIAVRRQRGARFWTVTAALVTLAIYLIPHSVLGSELDYSEMPPESGGQP